MVFRTRDKHKINLHGKRNKRPGISTTSKILRPRLNTWRSGNNSKLRLPNTTATTRMDGSKDVKADKATEEAMVAMSAEGMVEDMEEVVMAIKEERERSLRRRCGLET